jgi:3D (Asp-Asp-Asp) domain-containing protein
MAVTPRRRAGAAALALIIGLAVLGHGTSALASGGGGGLPGGSGKAGGSTGSGGTTPGGLAPKLTPAPKPKPKKPKKPKKRAKITHRGWVQGVTITEYWPVPESWFVGALVSAPGLSGKHRIDWLYSATGVSMEGDGIGLDGQHYHINALGDGGWVNADGGPSAPSAGGWSGGGPYWRAGAYWTNSTGAVTFPLQEGSWANGPGTKFVPLNGVTFAPGPSLALRYYQSIAVDPKLIPLGSRVYVPAYRHDGHGGWFVAQDTGGAIIGRHVDIYRPPPPSSSDTGQYLTDEPIYVVPAHG